MKPITVALSFRSFEVVSNIHRPQILWPELLFRQPIGKIGFPPLTRGRWDFHVSKLNHNKSQNEKIKDLDVVVEERRNKSHVIPLECPWEARLLLWWCSICGIMDQSYPGMTFLRPRSSETTAKARVEVLKINPRLIPQHPLLVASHVPRPASRSLGGLKSSGPHRNFKTTNRKQGLGCF